MVCSCAISSYCVNWLQITFCSCVNETVHFSFLRSLLRENGRSLRFPKIFIKKQSQWSNGKKTFELGYRKISWFVSVSQINYLPQPSASHWQIRIFFSTFSSRKAFISNERVLSNMHTSDGVSFNTNRLRFCIGGLVPQIWFYQLSWSLISHLRHNSAFLIPSLNLWPLN